jgi:Tetratricopeptide repeat
MEMSRKVLGAEHPDTWTSMNDLAITYQNQRRWKDAEVLGLQVMEMRKQVLGIEHPDTIESIKNLVITYQNQGRWKEIEELNVKLRDVKKERSDHLCVHTHCKLLTL